MKKRVKSIIRQWNGETPKVARMIRNAAATIAVAVPTAYGSVAAMGIDVQPVIKDTVAAVTFVSTLTVGVAGTKETNNAKAKRQNTDKNG